MPNIRAYKNDSTADLLFFFEHQYHFTKETISILLRRCGFQLLMFAKHTTNTFGMHLAAKKISKPIPPSKLEFNEFGFDQVIALINAYKEHLVVNSPSLTDELKRLLSERDGQRKRVILFGSSSYAKKFLEIPGIDKKSIKYIVDNNNLKWGGSLKGIPICQPGRIDRTVDAIIVTSGFYEEIYDQLLKMGISANKILKF